MQQLDPNIPLVKYFLLRSKNISNYNHYIYFFIYCMKYSDYNYSEILANGKRKYNNLLL